VLGRCFASLLFRRPVLGLASSRINNTNGLLFSRNLYLTSNSFRLTGPQPLLRLQQPQQQQLQHQHEQQRSAHTAKSHSGMKKRLRVRPNGSIRRSQAGRQHNTGYKKRSRKNRLGQPAGIKDKTIERKLKLCLGSRAM
jgi:ribosomal protein L35